MYDSTQGPACSIATGPATCYRNYFMRDLNNLDKVQDYLFNKTGKILLNINNGWVTSTRDNLQILNNNIQDVEEYIKFGIQWNSQCPFIDRYNINERDKQIVSQIYCSAIPISNKLWEPFAKLILKASYEATFLTALDNYNKTGSNKVFLTKLGGGFFENKKEWIIETLSECLLKFKNYDLQVFMVHYRNIDIDFNNVFFKLIIN
jgi:hypothetical protein